MDVFLFGGFSLVCCSHCLFRVATDCEFKKVHFFSVRKDQIWSVASYCYLLWHCGWGRFCCSESRQVCKDLKGVVKDVSEVFIDGLQNRVMPPFESAIFQGCWTT